MITYRVSQLSRHRWWADRQNPRKVLGASISSLAAETPSSLSCRVSRIHSAPSGLVLRFLKHDVQRKFYNFANRLEDGSKCSLRTVEFCGLDTQTDEVLKAPTFAQVFYICSGGGREFLHRLVVGCRSGKAGEG